MELSQMARAGAYLRSRGKRALRRLPPVLCVSLVLLLILGLFAGTTLRGYLDGTERQSVELGLVSEGDDPYLELALSALETMDRSRFSIHLTRCGEREAAALLQTGKLSAYLVVPEGFTAAMFAGETRPLRFVSGQGAADLGSMLTEELARSVAALVLETENAVYGAQSFAAEQLPEKNPYALGDRLAAEYLGAILARDELCVSETVGVGAGLGFVAYYCSALPVLFLLLFGILFAPLFRREEIQPRRLLAASGFGSIAQVLCEYLAYVGFTILCCGAMLALIALAALKFPALRALPLLHAPLRLVPPILLLCALHMLLHECSSGSAGALLLQFLVGASMAFVSGCFYPSSMLPVGMQAIGRILPSGAALQYLAQPSLRTLLLPALWLAALLALTWLLRRRSLEGGEGA